MQTGNHLIVTNWGFVADGTFRGWETAKQKRTSRTRFTLPREEAHKKGKKMFRKGKTRRRRYPRKGYSMATGIGEIRQGRTRKASFMRGEVSTVNGEVENGKTAVKGKELNPLTNDRGVGNRKTMDREGKEEVPPMTRGML